MANLISPGDYDDLKEVEIQTDFFIPAAPLPEEELQEMRLAYYEDNKADENHEAFGFFAPMFSFKEEYIGEDPLWTFQTFPSVTAVNCHCLVLDGERAPSR